ncbi:hypothetical protein F66182_8166 [Fusarium sp. NRRL 66182]|nr:hypothetical protein F66182_8166 [Fusarium sp. NRRL 66182]
MSKRRLACERCRNQKLKCIRRHENTSEPCIRCFQAQEECIVSLRKAPGRPSGRSSSLSQRSSMRETNNTAATVLGDNDPRVSNLGSRDDSMASEDPVCGSFDLDFDWSDASLFSATAPLTGYIPDISNPFLNHSEARRPEPCPMPWASSQEATTPMYPSSSQMLDQSFDPVFQLAQLQQNIAKQLIQLRYLRWDITSVLKLESSCHSVGGFDLSPKKSREFNPVIGAIEVIAEFEQVLNSPTSTFIHQERPGTTNVPRDMSLSYCLSAVSCYLQLVCMYDYIFSYVLDQVASNPAVRDFFLHSTPQISLGGFTIPSPKNLVGRSFVQLMQLKIRPVESALGLPDDCRLSKESGTDDGSERALLSGKQRESLLAVMRVPGLGETNSESASGVIESLKAKMTEIESLG